MGKTFKVKGYLDEEDFVDQERRDNYENRRNKRIKRDGEYYPLERDPNQLDLFYR